MANNFVVRDGNDVLKQIHTVEDSTSVHFNMHIITDVSGHTVGVVSGAAQAATSGMGALVVAHHPSSPLPAGTNLLGKVSIADSTLPVSGLVSVHPNGATNWPVSVANSTLAVTQSGTWNVAAITSINSIIRTSVDGLVGVTQSGTWTVQPGNTPNTTPWLVSVNGTTAVSVANTITVNTHAVTQSGSWAITSVNSRVAVSVENTNNIAVSVAPLAFNVPVSVANTLTVLPGNTANTTPWLVSVNGTTAVSVANTLNVNTHAVTQSGTWNVAALTSINSRVGVSVENTNNIAVSLAPPSYNVPVSVHPVTQSGTWSVGLTAGTALVGAVSISPNGLNIPVSIANTLTVLPGNTANTTPWLVSVNGTTAVSVANTLNVNTHAVTQSGTWNVAALTSINSIVKVSIEGTTLTASGISMTQTVGAAVTTEGYPMLGSDGTNARRLLTTTGGALVVHVSNTAPGGAAAGSAMTQTVNAAVTNQGYPMMGTDGTNAQIIKVDTSGVQVVTGRLYTSQYIFTRPNNATAYTAHATGAVATPGDLCANDTTASLVEPLKFRVSHVAGRMAYVRRARLFRSQGAVTTANLQGIAAGFRLHLFNTPGAVSVVNGDNVAMHVSPVSSYIGCIDLVAPTSASGLLTKAKTSGVYMQGIPLGASELICQLSATQVSIQGVLEVRSAFTPAANEVFTVQLDCFNS